MNAKDIMNKQVITVKEDMSIKALADLFVKKNIGGAPVVDADGKLIGMVTEGDLVSQDAQVHFPTYVHLLDGFFYFPSTVARFEKDFKHALGRVVKDVMTTDVFTAHEDASIEDMATWMVDKDISRLPILDKDGKLIGMVTKHDVVRAISKTA